MNNGSSTRILFSKPTVTLVGTDSFLPGVSHLCREQRSPNFLRELLDRFPMDMKAKRVRKSDKFMAGRLLPRNCQNSLKLTVSLPQCSTLEIAAHLLVILRNYSKFTKRQMRLHFCYSFYGQIACSIQTRIATIAKLKQCVIFARAHLKRTLVLRR